MRFFGCPSAGLALLVAFASGCPADDDPLAVEGDETGETSGDIPEETTGDISEETTGDISDDSNDLARLAAAMCERQTTCGCDAVSDPADAETCETEHYNGLAQLANNAAESDAYTFDAACLQQLAECWEALPCGRNVEELELCAPACAVHQRNLGAGEACEAEQYLLGPSGFLRECAPELSCQGGHGYAVCDDPTPLQAEESCDAGGHRRCADGLFCRGTETEPARCLPRIPEGGTCDLAEACDTGLRCADSVCVSRSEVGESCEVHGTCASGLACHPTDEVCVEAASVGEQCRFNDDGIGCVEGSWCSDNDNCELRSAIGSACPDENFYGCADGSSCVDGICSRYEQICSAVPPPYAYPPAP